MPLKTILVDDDLLSLKGFSLECSNLPDLKIVGQFTTARQALDFAQTNAVDFALLDVDMPEMNGLELGRLLRSRYPRMILVFVTAHSAYAVQAIRDKADYVVFKPYDRADVQDIIDRARLLRFRLEKPVSCRCFGRFDVFVNGQPVRFHSAKAKELLAFCVYRRGASVASEEIIEYLWEDYTGLAGNCSAFRMAVKALNQTLAEYGIADLFYRKRGSCGVFAQKIDSDYFSFLQGDALAVSEYHSEFMTDYSWGNLALYTLDEQKRIWEHTNKKMEKKESKT